MIPQHSGRRPDPDLVRLPSLKLRGDCIDVRKEGSDEFV